jgi:BASS family bile acid:Na+ symporter
VNFFRKASLVLSGVGLLLLLVGLAVGKPTLWQPTMVVAAVTLAIGLGAVPALKGFQFTGWIVAAVIVALVYPLAFLNWGGFDLRNKWIILIVVQAVMFGMGTQMKLKDFTGVLKMPWGVCVAVVGQFTIMPLVGLALTKVFSFPSEVAAGIILIGSCSSGLASNVMAWMARANLALSITATAVTTMLAPLMTPLWMKMLAGTLVEVNFFSLMIEIVKIVIVPIGAALLHDYLKTASPRGSRVIHILATAGALWLAIITLGGWSLLSARVPGAALAGLSLFGFMLVSVVWGVGYHWLTLRAPRLDSVMPLASMVGIVYFTTVTTAAGRDELLKVGGLLFLASVLHNAAGYSLGYWFARGCGLDQNSARAIAFEVGLQNGGMASGLAGAMGKLGTVGLAAAVFSPWMNISGSVLANFWRLRPASQKAAPVSVNDTDNSTCLFKAKP